MTIEQRATIDASTTDDLLAEVHRRVTEAVAAGIARGEEARDAFRAYATPMARDYPETFRAYVEWVAKEKAA